MPEGPPNREDYVGTTLQKGPVKLMGYRDLRPLGPPLGPGGRSKASPGSSCRGEGQVGEGGSIPIHFILLT